LEPRSLAGYVLLPLVSFVPLRGEVTAVVVTNLPAHSGMTCMTLKASYAQSSGRTGYEDPSPIEQTARTYTPPEFVLSA
jgi:hypothetical protein